MEKTSNDLIDALGGTSVVAKMISCPISTVHSWRKSGIPKSRLAHIQLAWESQGKSWPPLKIEREASRPKDSTDGMIGAQ